MNSIDKVVYYMQIIYYFKMKMYGVIVDRRQTLDNIRSKTDCIKFIKNLTVCFFKYLILMSDKLYEMLIHLTDN